MPIFLLSGGALAYEVILVRLLAMTRFHHLAFMVLSLALLAYGISGVLLAYLRPRLLIAFRTWFSVLAALFAAGTMACFHLSQRIPIDPAQWVWSPTEAVSIVGLYLTLSLPLLAAASAVGLAYCRQGEGAGRVYRADLLGAAAGSLGVLPALWLPGAAALWVPWSAGMIAAALAAAPDKKRVACGCLLMAALGPLAGPKLTGDLRLSPHKPLARALDAEGSERVVDLFSPLGRLTITRNDLAPFRQAAGLSLAYPGRVKAQWGLFTDGEGFEPLPATPAAGEKAVFAHLEFLPEALAYALGSRPRVLVLESPVLVTLERAILKRATRVDLVLSNPGWRTLMEDPVLAGSLGRLASQRVHLKIGAPRGFMRRRGPPYDLIVIGPPSPSAFKADYGHTVEAYVEALDRLTPGGLLSLSGPSDLPPRTGLRLLTTAAAALAASGVTTPADHLVFIRSLRTVHLLVSRSPLSPEEIEAVRAFCRSRRFDPVWFPGMRPDEANRWNRLGEPLYHTAARSLLGPQKAAFQSRYKFNLLPARDDRPYFSRFLKPATIRELFSLKGSGGFGMLSLAEPVLAATLVQAVFFSLLAIWLPLRRFRPDRPASGPHRAAPGGWLFFLLGAGFMLAEFAVLEKMRLFLNAPVLAAGVTLGSFLALAGLGGGLSVRFLARGRPALGRIALALATVLGLLLLYLTALPALLAALLTLSTGMRLALAPLIIAPLALVMGFPFPLAIAALQKDQAASIPWAWGLNGCGALIGPVIGMGLAVYVGITAVLWAAVVCYTLAGLSLLRSGSLHRRRPR